MLWCRWFSSSFYPPGCKFPALRSRLTKKAAQGRRRSRGELQAGVTDCAKRPKGRASITAVQCLRLSKRWIAEGDPKGEDKAQTGRLARRVACEPSPGAAWAAPKGRERQGLGEENALSTPPRGLPRSLGAQSRLRVCAHHFSPPARTARGQQQAERAEASGRALRAETPWGSVRST